MVEQRGGVAFEDLDHGGRLFQGQPRRAKSVRRPIQVRPRCMRDVLPGRVQQRLAAMSDRLHVQIATGAIAGAVSMMAGRYLDVQSVGHRGEALLNTTRQHIAHAPGPYLDRASHRLRAAGLTLEEATTVVEVFERNPDALLDPVSYTHLTLPTN